MPHRDAGLFGLISAGLVVTVSLLGCSVFAWVLLTRRIIATEVEAVFSVLLLAGFLWTAGFLFPMARRNHDLFGIVCTVIAAFAALAAWLLLGVGVRSR
jgi:hypothetical protein